MLSCQQTCNEKDIVTNNKFPGDNKIMERHITTPLTKDMVKEINAGDYVYITGIIYTARDAAHLRLYDSIY